MYLRLVGNLRAGTSVVFLPAATIMRELTLSKFFNRSKIRPVISSFPSPADDA